MSDKSISLLGISKEISKAEGNRKMPSMEVLHDSLSLSKSVSTRSKEFRFKTHQYRFIGKLGKGAFATVMKAVWLPKQINVAVKIMRKVMLIFREESLRTELEILLQADHPNLLKLLDWGFDDDYIYLVTELAAGGELFPRIVEKCFVSERNVADVIRSTLQAVEYLHSKDIVHRDLKPENILMRDPKHKNFSDILVGDFGISGILASGNQLLKTKTGTFGYIAPEILLGKTYGKPCDIWSIGVITYVLLSGMYPYTRNGFDEELEDILNTTLTYNEPCWDHISNDAKSFTQDCLKITSNLRPTAKEALDHPWLQLNLSHGEHELEDNVPDSTEENLEIYSSENHPMKSLLPEPLLSYENDNLLPRTRQSISDYKEEKT